MIPIRSIVIGLIAMTIVSSSGAKTLQFSGRTWNIKKGNGLGPGPNNWSDNNSHVFVDNDDKLHLKVEQIGSSWFSSEVTLQQSLGYGTYEFRLETDVEQFDRNVVLGLFTYKSDVEEIDIELTQFGRPNDPYGHFVVQPAFHTGNRSLFDLNLNSDFSTHSFTWLPDRIEFQSLHGHRSIPQSPTDIIHQFTYTGADIPPDSTERVHINFWQFQGNPPSNGQSHEVVIESFTFIPAGSFLADFDNDSDVDGDDLMQWEDSFGANNLSDADRDGDSDGGDFLIWQQQFGSGTPPVVDSGSVPEPSTWGLLITLVFGWPMLRIGKFRSMQTGDIG